MTTTPNWLDTAEQMLNDTYAADKPGAAVIIVKNGEALLRKGYGLAQLELGVPIEPHMVFRLGSITKQFTAVSILMLYEQGKLDLQDEFTRFLPDYPTQGRKITITHLLTHTSGIKSYTSMSEWLPLWRKDLTLDELINLFKDQPFDFEPGEQFLYNNSGYILLGAIIEKISGTKYADFLQANIFGPLEMTHTQYDQTEQIIPGRVAGYSAGKDGSINAAYLSMTQPHAAGALVSSVDDLALWETALANNRLLKPETLEKAFQPYTLNNGQSTGYGYGWAISRHEDMRFIEHGGGINGFATGGARVPSEKIYVAVLTNYDAPKIDPSQMAYELAALASGHPVVKPTPIELPEKTLDNYIGVYAIPPDQERVITCQGKQLFSQRSGGMRLELFPYEPDKFFLKDSSDRFVFTRQANGQVNGIQAVRRLGPSEFAPKTDKPLPAERQAITLAAEQINRLPGTYELAPGLNLEIILADGQLLIQAPGQEKLKLFAESPTCLFAREVDLSLALQFDAEGRVTGAVLKQGPETMPIKKVA